MGGTSGRVTAQNIFHKCCVGMCGKTCASKLEFSWATPAFVRELNCWTLRRSLIAVLCGSVLNSTAYILLNEISVQPPVFAIALLYVVLLLIAIAITSQRSRASSIFFEVVISGLILCITVVNMYFFLVVGDYDLQGRALQRVPLIWKQVCLLVGSRWWICAGMLVWVTVHDVLGMWQMNMQFGIELQVEDIISTCVVSLCFLAVAWAGHRRMSDYYEAYQQLSMERKATSTILSMVCDSVIWLSDDGDTISKSSQHFDYLIRQGMQGKRISSCFDTDKEQSDLRDALRRARRGPVLLTCELRSITKRRIGVDVIVIRRTQMKGRTTGDLLAEQDERPSGFLLGIRSSRLSLAPQGTPTSRPMALADLEMQLPEVLSDSEGEGDAKQQNGSKRFSAQSNSAPPSPPPLSGDGANSMRSVPAHLRCSRCGGSGVDPIHASAMNAGAMNNGTMGPGSPVSTKASNVNQMAMLQSHDAGEDITLQHELGPQSLRGGAPQDPLSSLEYHPHALECFEMFMQTEEAMCGEWAVFYHSYSFAGLVYEIQAALAAALFGFPAGVAPLPRIRFADFKETPDAAALIEASNTKFVGSSMRRDHHPEFRAVAIPAVCSLVSQGPGVSTPVMFLTGLSQDDISFAGPLEEVLSALHLPTHRLRQLQDSILSLASIYNLDASMYGGQPCQSGKNGHLLQIFVRRSKLDELAFAAKPMGEVDEVRQPISWWLSSDVASNFGQARLVTHPMRFMSADSVRMYVASADPTFHHERPKFQEELIHLLTSLLEEENCRMSVASKIYGGTPPEALVLGLAGQRETCLQQ